MCNFTLSVSYTSGSCITCHKEKGLGWIRHRSVYLRWQDKSLNWNEMEIHCNLIVFWIPTVAILPSFLRGWWVHVGLFCCWKSFPSIKSSVLRRKTRKLQATPRFEGFLIFFVKFHRYRDTIHNLSFRRKLKTNTQPLSANWLLNFSYANIVLCLSIDH